MPDLYRNMAEASWACLRAYHLSLGRPAVQAYEDLSEEDREALVARAFWSGSTLPRWGNEDEALSIEGALMVAVVRAIKNAVAEAEKAGLGVTLDGTGSSD